MQITVLKETQPGETRVALVPESVKKLVALKVQVSVESGAGIEAGASDADYEAVGATIAKDRGAGAYAMLCTLFPPGDRASLCADIEALKDSASPIALRQKRAQKALETVIQQITAPPKSVP